MRKIFPIAIVLLFTLALRAADKTVDQLKTEAEHADAGQQGKLYAEIAVKLVAVAVAGSGHWISGTITVICAYAVSLLLVERLFRIVKPKLLTLPWFARLWGCLVAAKDRVLSWFR